MAFHHVAVAVRDLDATHRFYTEVMGFALVKVVAAPTPEGGWARHVFYETDGGGLIAFWDLHVEAIGEFDPAISTALGLPVWTNHLAFDAPSLGDLERARRRWQEHGHTVLEVDHGWCTSIYITDPNGIMVEFCTTTREFTAADRAEAARLLTAAQPELGAEPSTTVHRPTRPATVPG